MDNFGEGDRPPVTPDSNGLTPLTVGLILGVVGLIVFCCLGWAALAVFAPAAPH